MLYSRNRILVPVTRKTSNDRKQTATTTAIKPKTTTEAETEGVTAASTTKTVRTIATIATTRTTTWETATNKITGEKYVPFYTMFQSLNDPNGYINNNKTTSKNISYNVNRPGTTAK